MSPSFLLLPQQEVKLLLRQEPFRHERGSKQRGEAMKLAGLDGDGLAFDARALRSFLDHHLEAGGNSSEAYRIRFEKQKVVLQRRQNRAKSLAQAARCENAEQGLANARSGLRDMGLRTIAESPWRVRRVLRLARALVRGEPYPELPSAAGAAALVERLGSEDLDERERAEQDLNEAGEGALPALRRALRSDDAEVWGRPSIVITEMALEGDGAPAREEVELKGLIDLLKEKR